MFLLGFLKVADENVEEVDHEIPHGYESALEEMRAKNILYELKKLLLLLDSKLKILHALIGNSLVFLGLLLRKILFFVIFLFKLREIICFSVFFSKIASNFAPLFGFSKILLILPFTLSTFELINNNII